MSLIFLNLLFIIIFNSLNKYLLFMPSTELGAGGTVVNKTNMVTKLIRHSPLQNIEFWGEKCYKSLLNSQRQHFIIKAHNPTNWKAKSFLLAQE